jgi:hypothetical protein
LNIAHDLALRLERARSGIEDAKIAVAGFEGIDEDVLAEWVREEEEHLRRYEKDPTRVEALDVYASKIQWSTLVSLCLGSRPHCVSEAGGTVIQLELLQDPELTTAEKSVVRWLCRGARLQEKQ